MRVGRSERERGDREEGRRVRGEREEGKRGRVGE